MLKPMAEAALARCISFGRILRPPSVWSPLRFWPWRVWIAMTPSWRHPLSVAAAGPLGIISHLAWLSTRPSLPCTILHHLRQVA